jgi:hypothetical protein
MQQGSNSSICVFPISSARPAHGYDSLPIGGSSSGDSLFVGDDGFIKVLLAQHTGLLVGLYCVGTILQLWQYVKEAVAYETESISISPPMYRDKSPVKSALMGEGQH